MKDFSQLFGLRKSLDVVYDVPNLFISQDLSRGCHSCAGDAIFYESQKGTFKVQRDVNYRNCSDLMR